jgi:hypothetical protein
MKPIILTLLMALSWISTFAQVSVSYFPIQSVLAISSNTERLVWADYKVETNTFFSNLNMELSPKINFRRTPAVNYYSGAGISFNPAYQASDLPIVNGYFLDLGVRIKPIRQYRNLQLVFEVSPYLNKEFNGGSLRTRLGISYNFTRKITN